MTNKLARNQKNHKVSAKELNPLKLWKKGKTVITDDAHIIGWGLFENIPKDVLTNYYSNICFNFDFLEDALKFFKSTHQDHSLIRCYIPNRPAPVFFVSESNVINRKQSKETFYAIAPRIEDEKLFQTKRGNGN